MSVEKTIVWENEKWSLTQYFDGVWTLKSKGEFAFKDHELNLSLDFLEISELKEILLEVPYDRS